MRRQELGRPVAASGPQIGRRIADHVDQLQRLAEVDAAPAQLRLTEPHKAVDVLRHQVGPKFPDAARREVGVLIELGQGLQGDHLRRLHCRLSGREALQVDGHPVRELVEDTPDQLLVPGRELAQDDQTLAEHGEQLLLGGGGPGSRLRLRGALQLTQASKQRAGRLPGHGGAQLGQDLGSHRRRQQRRIGHRIGGTGQQVA